MCLVGRTRVAASDLGWTGLNLAGRTEGAFYSPAHGNAVGSRSRGEIALQGRPNPFSQGRIHFEVPAQTQPPLVDPSPNETASYWKNNPRQKA